MRSIAEKIMNRSIQLKDNTIAEIFLLNTIGTFLLGCMKNVQQFATLNVGDFASIASDKKINNQTAAFLMGVAFVAIEYESN